MKPATHTKNHLSLGQWQTTASTPRSHQNQSTAAFKATEAVITGSEVLVTRLKEAQQNLALERSRGLELRDEIDMKRRRNAEMEDLHQGNQSLIEKYEHELATSKPCRNGPELHARIAQLETTAVSTFQQLDSAVNRHLAIVAELSSADLPDRHSNKVVELSLGQLRLYQSQIQQKEESSRMKLEGLQRRQQALMEEVAALKEEIKGTKAARLADMKKLQKLRRLELHSSEVIKHNHVKPVDVIAVEATKEVFAKLQEKMPKDDENQNFLRNLGEKLRSRGVKIDI